MTALAPAIARPSSLRSRIAFDVAAVAAGSLIVAGLAQLSIKLHFTPVPITGQTLGVLLVGASLGAARGGASLLLYVAEGAIGLPFFADGGHGLDVLKLTSASGGYLWGFVAAAIVVGYLAERGWDRSLGSSIGAMLIAEILIYGAGVPWLSQSIHVSANKALELGMYPFVIGDVIKLLIAAGVLPAAWKLLKRFRPES
jgi:biotin transport system substrate-specific component